MKIENRTFTVPLFISDDGREFTSEDACRNHESNRYINNMLTYIKGKVVYRLGGDNREILVKVDEKIVEWADYVDTPYFNAKQMRKFLGSWAILSYDQDNACDTESWDIVGDVENSIWALTQVIEDLKELTNTDVPVESDA